MEPDEELDVKGKTCPMPVLLTRKKIKELASGMIFKIIGDFQPAKNNIQNFLNKEGHTILAVEETRGVYEILVKIK